MFLRLSAIGGCVKFLCSFWATGLIQLKYCRQYFFSVFFNVLQGNQHETNSSLGGRKKSNDGSVTFCADVGAQDKV